MTNKFISWVRNESPPFEQSPICTVLPVFHLFQGGIVTFLQGTATILLFGIKVRTGAGMELWSANTPCQMSQGLLRVLDLSCKWSRIIRGNGGSIIFSFYIKFLLIVNKNKGWAQCLDKKLHVLSYHYLGAFHGPVTFIISIVGNLLLICSGSVMILFR